MFTFGNVKIQFLIGREQKIKPSVIQALCVSLLFFTRGVFSSYVFFAHTPLGVKCDRSCDRVAFAWQISFDASKEFVDSQGITQMQVIPRRTILLEPTVRSYTINELSPFTTYSVNVSAIPSDRQYRPPTKIAVTTQMAGT